MTRDLSSWEIKPEYVDLREVAISHQIRSWIRQINIDDEQSKTTYHLFILMQNKLFQYQRRISHLNEISGSLIPALTCV